MSDRSGTPSLFARAKRRLFGTTDPIEAQLREIERQGASLSALAHLAAAGLILLFSVGSLLGLSHDALIVLQQQWQTSHTIDLPSALAAAVNGLLVLVMDTALLYAASMLRIIKARQGDGAGVHVLVMIGVSAIEGATWAYFSWLYDRPHDPIAWGLIAARASAAPLLSAYLSLARPIPIGPRDILYQAAMASGKGVIRDVTREANDESAPLARKVTIYRAAALMHPTDRARLDQLVEAASRHADQQPPSESLRTPQPIGVIAASSAPSKPPAAPSLPSSVLPFAGRSDHMPPHQETQPNPPPGFHLISPGAMPHQDPDHDHRVFLHNLSAKRPRPQTGISSPKPPKPPTQPMTREQIYRARLRAARRLLADTPDIGLRELTRKIAIATQHRISESTAARLRDELRSSAAAPQIPPTVTAGDPPSDPVA